MPTHELDVGPRQNRVDPFGDLHAVAERGMFTGNRGCLVDETGRLVRHHRGQLWITCVTSYKDWKSPLDQPGRWTPVFFLDDAVALAAGHRPCGLCRRPAYLAYRKAVQSGNGSNILATDLNRMLAKERLDRGRGLYRAKHRKLWRSDFETLPDGTVVLNEGGTPRLLMEDLTFGFGFDGWADPAPRPTLGEVTVLTPPTSVLALRNGFRPVIHPSGRSN